MTLDSPMTAGAGKDEDMKYKGGDVLYDIERDLILFVLIETPERLFIQCCENCPLTRVSLRFYESMDFIMKIGKL